MKNPPSSHNGKSASNGHSDRATGGPVLRIHVGDQQPRTVRPAIFGPADWDTLGDELQHAAGHVVLEFQGLPKWPDDARYSMLTLVKGLGTRCRLRIGKKTYNDPFEAILAAMPGLKSLEAHRQGFRAAVEAASVFYADMPDAAAKRINDRLAEVGAGKMNCPRLVKQIRETAGTAKVGPQLDAHAAAQEYVAHLTEVVNAVEGQPVLRYYQGDFYVWTGKVWSPQEDRNFDAQVMAFLQTLKIPNITTRFAKDVVAHLAGMANFKCWKEPMPFLVVSENPLEFKRPHLIVFNNGMIDLDQMIAGAAPEIKPVDSAYFNAVVLPYDYDPRAKCKLWKETIKGILPTTGHGDNRCLVLQEFMGYSLLPDCRFQKMLAGVGEGGNGKTTLVKPWQAMLGAANFSSVPLEVLGNEHRQFSLNGKLANFSAEFPYLGRVNEGMLKSLISGEEMEVNRKFKDPVKIRPYAKLVVHANEMPQIQDPTEGTWDRVIAMPFEVRLRDSDKDDKGRVEKLKAELPGIFNWAIQGLKRLLKQGHFTACAKCAEFLAQHRTESDTVRLFAAECCEKKENRVTFSVPLYRFYKHYCEATSRKPVADSEFGKRMQRLKWKKEREKTGKRRLFYRGMGLSQTGFNYMEGMPDKVGCGWPISCSAGDLGS